MSGIVKLLKGHRWTIVLATVCAFSTARLALAATGSFGGGAQPSPQSTVHLVGDQFNIDLFLANSSFSTQSPNVGKGISMQVNLARMVLACSNAGCPAGTDLFNTLEFVPMGANGCVTSDACVVGCTDKTCASGADTGKACMQNADCSNNDCTRPTQNAANVANGRGANRVFVITNNCVLPPSGFGNFATIAVKQVGQTASSFFVKGEADYQGTLATCTAGICPNAANNHTCTGDPPTVTTSNCDWRGLVVHGDGVGRSGGGILW